MNLDKKMIGVIAASALFGGIIGGGVGASLGSFHHGSRGGYGRHGGGRMTGGDFHNSNRFSGMMNTRSQQGAPASYTDVMNQAQQQGTTTR